MQLQAITATLANCGFVNDYCIRNKADGYVAVVYLDSSQCWASDKRKQAISNIEGKLNELSFVDMASDALNGTKRQNRGIVTSFRLYTA